ncbi:MAG: hypothetical protein AAF125_28475, partial [Chloroflexota bacterium]
MPERSSQSKKTTTETKKAQPSGGFNVPDSGAIEGMEAFLEAPSVDNLTPAIAMRLQRQIGNHALQQLIQRAGGPNDKVTALADEAPLDLNARYGDTED